jgi:RNA polymerase sigma-70 factor, ECF subfamily
VRPHLDRVSVSRSDRAPVIAQDARVDRIREGGVEAFEALVREHHRGLCTFAARLVGSDAIAEELVQDVFLTIWRQRESWRVTGTVAGYLYGAVRNQALMHLRRERSHRRWHEWFRREDAGGSGPPPATDTGVRLDELRVAIERAIATLPPRCREAYLLRRQHHLSYTEIAQVMRITPKTVEIQIGTALKALRVRLAEWLEP